MAVASGSSLLVRSKVVFGYNCCWPFIKKHTKNRILYSNFNFNATEIRKKNFFGFGEVSENLKVALTWKLNGPIEKFLEFFYSYR